MFSLLVIKLFQVAMIVQFVYGVHYKVIVYVFSVHIQIVFTHYYLMVIILSVVHWIRLYVYGMHILVN